MECAKQREECAADQNVMEMSNNEERVMYLQIERYRGEYHARETPQDEDEDEPEDEMHCCIHP